MPTKRTATPQAKIRARAHELWVQQGRPEGQHLEHWQQAEAELAGKKSAGPRQRTATKPAAAKPAATRPAATAKPAAAKPAARKRSRSAAR
jgi:hypothetical protein